jgi:hypothetical protein
MADFYKNNDDFIRDKVTNHQFEQVPGAWDSMSKLLNQNQLLTKSASNLWWTIPAFSAALLAVIIGMGVYLTPDEQVNEEMIAELISLEESVEQVKLNKTENNSFLNLNGQNSDYQTVQDEQRDENKITSANEKETEESIAKKNYSDVSLNNNTENDNSRSNKTSVTASEYEEEILDRKSERFHNSIKSSNAANQQNTEKEDTEIKEPITNLKSVATDGNKNRVKKSTTIITKRYSTSTYNDLQSNKTKIINEKQTPLNFGIGDEVISNNKCPLKLSVYGGVTGKIFGHSKEFSAMPAVGVSTSYRIAPRHSIEAGLQYKSISKPKSIIGNEYAELRYHTAINSSKSYSLDRVDLLELPVSYHLHLSPVVNIQAGLKGVWLFNTETSNPEFNTKTNEELGIANFDLGVLLGLEFNLNKHWAIGIQYNIGLLNLTQQGELRQEQLIDSESGTGININEKMDALSTQGELVVPVPFTENNPHQEMIRLPENLHNNDVQILLKYTF